MPLGRLALFAAGGVGFVVGLALDGGGPGGDGDRPASRDADAERFVPPAVADGRAAREPEPTASAPASPAIERVSNDAVDARAEATTDARAEEPAVADAEAPPAPEAEHPAEAEEPVEVPVSRVEDQVSPVVVRLVDGAIRALVDAERASADAERERVVAHLVTAATAAVVAEAAADANAANAEPRSAVDPTPARARSVPSVHQTKSAMSVSRPAHSTRVAPRAVTFADDARSPPPRVPSIDVPSTPSRGVPPPTVCESPFIVAGGAKRLIRGEGGRGLVRRRDQAPAPPRGGPPLADARADADEETLGEIAEEPRTPGPKFGAVDPRLAFKTPGPVLPDTPDSAGSDGSEHRGEDAGTGTEDISPGDGAVKLHVSLDDWSRPGFVAASRAGAVRYSSEMDADDEKVDEEEEEEVDDEEEVNDENAHAVSVSVASGKGLANAPPGRKRRVFATEINAA